MLDPRVHAFRADLADAALAGQLFAPHYARPVTRTCSTATAARSDPSKEADPLFDMQPGEEFALLDVTGGWAWGYRRSDHLVGYVPAHVLDE